MKGTPFAVALAFLVAPGPADAAAKELKGHSALVYSLAFSPDGRQLASAGADALVKVWDVAAQKELKTLKGHEGAVTGVVFTPDGKDVLSIGFDRYLRVWEVASGKETKKLGPAPDDLYGL